MAVTAALSYYQTEHGCYRRRMACQGAPLTRLTNEVFERSSLTYRCFVSIDHVDNNASKYERKRYFALSRAVFAKTECLHGGGKFK